MFALGVALSVLPVLVLLGALVVIDSYKLVALRAVLLAVGVGAAMAALCYVVNLTLAPALGWPLLTYARYVSPVVEEVAKASFVVWLLSRNRIGFVVDAAIFGFAIGTGFALTENVYYVLAAPTAPVWTWLVRGIGTAVMHGCATAAFAMAARALHGQQAQLQLTRLLPGLLLGILLHSLYNHFLLQPLTAAGLVLLVFPWVAVWLFERSDRETRQWLGSGFDTDQALLQAMRAGALSGTPVGTYLTTVRQHFDPEVIVDMLCLLRLRAELGIRAKAVLMAREVGFEMEADPSLPEKFTELRYLERSIGTTGMRALQPFLHTSTQDLWQLNMLNEGNA
ncbi:MAG: PrsW family intramembrane metalloprotease [Gemmatimonadaceae bacterium]|nr:PrsW family intramembrane metalloprotease [Gemmatimonadaceae bacterium]